MPGAREENLTSTNFLGFKLRCQYVAPVIGVGIVTPAVYIAYHMLHRLTRLVTSLISTGASLLALRDL